MRRVIELGYFRFDKGIFKDNPMLCPCGWVVEEWSVTESKWVRVNQVHPDDAYALAGFDKPRQS